MPTGYTADITKKENYSFEDFVWKCSRAMGPLCMQRDEPLDAPIKIPDGMPGHYEESLKSTQAELEQMLELGEKKWKEKNLQEIEARNKRYEEAIATAKAAKIKYESMLEKVNLWDCPTKDHEPLKELMIHQLTQAIDHDCNTKYYESVLAELVAEEKDDYSFDEAIDDVKKSIERYRNKIEECKASSEFAVNWLRELVKSVGNPPQNEEKLFKDI